MRLNDRKLRCLSTDSSFAVIPSGSLDIACSVILAFFRAELFA